MDITNSKQIELLKELSANVLSFNIVNIGDKILLGLYSGNKLLVETYVLQDAHIPEVREAISLRFWSIPEMWTLSLN